MKTRMLNGYPQFWDEREERWVFTHIRAMENKLGRAISPDRVVHHIDGDKTNNKHANLVAITRGIHARIHGNHPDACFNCGRDGHWSGDCEETKDYAGNLIVRVFDAP